MITMKTSKLLILLCACVAGTAFSQGTLVYDQESSNDEAVFGGALPVQLYSTLGQSFTPSMATVGFVQLRFLDINPNNNSGATVVIKLRANSMNGAVIGTSQLAMADGFTGSASFYLVCQYQSRQIQFILSTLQFYLVTRGG